MPLKGQVNRKNHSLEPQIGHNEQNISLQQRGNPAMNSWISLNGKEPGVESTVRTKNFFPRHSNLVIMPTTYFKL